MFELHTKRALATPIFDMIELMTLRYRPDPVFVVPAMHEHFRIFGVRRRPEVAVLRFGSRNHARPNEAIPIRTDVAVETLYGWGDFAWHIYLNNHTCLPIPWEGQSSVVSADMREASLASISACVGWIRAARLATIGACIRLASSTTSASRSRST